MDDQFIYYDQSNDQNNYTEYNSLKNILEQNITLDKNQQKKFHFL